MERFKSAYGIPTAVKVTSSNGVAMVCFQDGSSSPSNQPVIDEARIYLNTKQRCCEEKHCTYIGNFHELQKQAEVNHPYSCPLKTDPRPELDWENVQQSSDIVNAFGAIHAEVPHNSFEHGDSETGDEHRSRGDGQSRNELISNVSYIGKASSSFYESMDSPKLIMDLCKQMLVPPGILTLTFFQFMPLSFDYYT